MEWMLESENDPCNNWTVLLLFIYQFEKLFEFKLKYFVTIEKTGSNAIFVSNDNFEIQWKSALQVSISS